MNHVDCERVFQLWDEVAAFPSAEIDRAWRHLAGTLAGWVHADTGYWVGTVRLLHGDQAARDIMFGWRVKVVTHLHPPSELEQLATQHSLNPHPVESGLSTIEAVPGSGVYRVHRLHDGFVDLDELRKTAYYQSHYVAIGVKDQLWVASPVSPETEAYVVFERRQTPALFNEADAELASFALRGMNWFHRRMFYSHGLVVAQEPLTPRQREVLQLLLTDKTEKEIATELGQSFHTTHTHVKDIFRKYNVKSRAGLMAVWLGKC